jgi:anti-sigma factor RsiW
MTDIICRYRGERESAIVSYVYDDIDPAERRAFEEHLPLCARCRHEVNALGGVRAELARWAPPDLVGSVASVISPVVAAREPAGAVSTATAGVSASPSRSWWRQPPAWAQVAAASLFFGAAAGIANLDVRYDRDGVSVRTGWSPRVHNAPAATVADVGPTEAAAAWREELAALESRLRADLTPLPAAVVPARTLTDADLLKRVRDLIDESERRQQRELALRVADVMRDVDSRRRADLVKIDRSLGAIQNNTGVEVMKQRELLNYLVRVSQKQ